MTGRFAHLDVPRALQALERLLERFQDAQAALLRLQASPGDQEAEERLHGALAGLGEPGRAFAAAWGLQAPARTS